MALPEVQQAVSVLKRASGVLLIVPAKPSSDAFSSMVALYVALQGQKDVLDEVSPTHVPGQLQFLPGSSQTKMEPHIQPDIVVDIAGPKQISNIRHEQLNGGIRLHITLSDGGEIMKDNIETHVRQMPYDAVVVIGASDLEELGEVFTNHADFFYNTPIINIDHRANNEHFGTVNLVDITASSIAEVMHELISNLQDVTIESDIATNLYAGIVAATDSFQKPSTTPHAFQLAAELMDKGADKETVIQYLVKTKPLHLLKLAGRTYARLRFDEHGQLFWSILRPIDFHESGAKPEHISDVMKELTNNISGYNAAFILYQDENNKYTTYLLLGKGLLKRKQEIREKLTAKKENGALILSLEASSLSEAEERALQQVRSILP